MGAVQEEGSEAAAHAHFKAEGDVEFRSILYVPAAAPWDFYDTYYSRTPAVKLYVRRVFISDGLEELLPRYLSFLLGLVDSDTLPLNVSREMLQQHSSLRTIKKKLVRDRCGPSCAQVGGRLHCRQLQREAWRLRVCEAGPFEGASMLALVASSVVGDWRNGQAVALCTRARRAGPQGARDDQEAGGGRGQGPQEACRGRRCRRGGGARSR